MIDEFFDYLKIPKPTVYKRIRAKMTPKSLDVDDLYGQAKVCLA